MRKLVLFAFLLVCPALFAQQTEVSYSDDFQSYGSPRNPDGWVDTSIGSSHPSANGLYKTWPDPTQGNHGSNIVFGTKQSSGKPEGNNPRIGTFSTLQTRTFSTNGRFEYRGRFIRTSSDTRIGFTFLSSYPEKDSYYLLGLWSQNGGPTLTMQLFGFGAGTLANRTDSAFTPATNTWYRFFIQVDDTGSATNIRARFWADGTTEPSTFSIDATDAAATRLKSGRIGIWSAVKGDAYVDDLSAKSPVDHTAPAISFFEGSVQLQPNTTTALDHDARVDVRATDDASGVATLTATVDGAPYTPLTPIAAEGLHTIHARAVDRAGNAVESEVKVLVDKSQPVVTLTESGTPLPLPNSKFNRPPSIDIQVTDAWTATTYTATLDGHPYVAKTPIAQEGTHYLVVDALDGVRNRRTVQATILVDLGAPTIAFYAAGVKLDPIAKFKIDPAIEVRLTDAQSTPTYTATLDGHAWRSLDPIPTEGWHKIVVNAVDEAGNPATATLDVLVDKVAPVVVLRESGTTLDPAQTAKFARDAAVEILASDATTQVQSAATLDGAAYTSLATITAEGTHALKVHATDEAGNVTDVTLSLLVDKSAPVIAFYDGATKLDPRDLQKFRRDVAIDVRATDAVSSATFTATLDGAPYTTNTNIVAEGEHALVVHAIDAAGNTADATLTLLVDKTKPAIAFSESGTALDTNVQTPFGRDAHVVISVTDNLPGVAYTAKLDGTDYTSGAAIATDGPHVVAVHATDRADNTTDAEVRVLVDKTGPLVKFLESNAVLDTSVRRDFNRVPSIDLQVTDALSAVTFTATLDGTQPYVAKTPVPQGAHSITVHAVDALGNATDGKLDLLVDTEPPVVGLVANGQPLPATGAIFAHDVTVVANVSDTSQWTTEATLDDRPFSLSLPVSAEGTHTLVVKVTDELQWTTTVSATFIVDQTPPKISVFEGTTPLLEGASFARDIALNASAEDITPYELTAHIDGAPYVLGQLYTTNGSHKIVVDARDAAGNTSTSPEILFHLDKNAPEVSLLESGQPFPVGKTFTRDVVAGVHVVAATETTKTATIDGQAYVLDTPYVPEGKHHLKVVVTNLAGLSTTVEADFTIDRTPPTLRLFAAPGKEFVDNSFKFAGDITPSTEADDNLSKPPDVVVLLDNHELPPGRVVSEEKVHTISATATDAGGLTKSVGPFTFVLDKTAPDVHVRVDGEDLEDGAKFKAAITPEITADDLTETTYTLTLNDQPYTRGTAIEADARYTLVVHVKDDVGNERALEPIHFVIDKTAPVVHVVEHLDDADQPFTGGKFKRSVTPLVRIDDLTETITNATLSDGQHETPWTSGQEISSEGVYTLNVTVTDELGWVTVVPPIAFTIDKSAPVVTVTESGAPLVSDTIFNRDVTPKIESNDTTHVTIEATLDDAPFTSETTVTREDRHVLVIKATDELGFVTNVPPIVFTVDKTPPVVTLTENGTPFVSGALLAHPALPQVAVSDLTAYTIDAKLDGNSYILGTPIAGDGAHSLDIKVTDAANWSTTVPTVHFVVDTTPPAVSVKVGDRVLATSDEFGDTIAPIIAVDDISATTVEATLDGAPWTSGTPIADEREHVLAVSVTDAAHWTTTLPPITFIIDKSAPVVHVLEHGVAFTGGKFNRDVEPKLDIDDLTATTTTATLDNAPWTPDSTISTELADHVLAITVTDHLGHATVVPPITFTIDKTAPVVTVTENGQPFAGGAFNRNVHPELTVSDTTPTTTTALLNEQPFTFGGDITAEGKYSLTATVTDELAWSTTIPAIVFYIDRTAPVVTLMEGEKELTDGQFFNRDVVPRAVITDTTDTTTTATLNDQPYTLETPVTAEGTYTLKVRVTDRVGLSTDVPPVTFTIDKTPPAIAITSPLANTSLTTPRILVSGDADDAIGIEVNGIDATIADRKFTTPVELELLEGENTIEAIGFDRAGNNTTIAIPVTLDTLAPAVTIEAPSANACLDTNAVEVRGQVSEVSLASVKVTMGTAVVNATVGDDHRTFTATIPAPDEGKFTIRVEAVDLAGHTAAATVAISIDRTKPVVEVREGGAPFAAPVVNRPIALDVRANEAGAALTVTLDGQPYVSGTAIANELPAPHVLRATARDCAGHVSDEKVVAFTIDRTPPFITSIDPANNATVGEKPASLTGTLSEPAAVVIESTGQTAQVDGVHFTLPVALQEGLNTLALLAIDAAGNQSRMVYTLTIRGAAPSVEIVENGLPIPPHQVYRRAVTPVIRSNDSAATIAATLNGAPFTSGSEVTNDGDYTLTAKAKDAFGHESATVTATFRIDRSVPVVTITTPADHAVIDADRVEVQGTVSGHDVVSVTVNGVAATLAGGAFSATVPLDAGPNTIVAIAADAAGNSASDSVDVVRDSGGNGLLLFAPVDKMLTNRPTTLVAGQVLTPAAARGVTINGATVALDPAGAFRKNDFPLVEGANTITASLTNDRGQVSSVSVHVTADFTPPVLRVTANGADLADGAHFAASPSLALDVTDNQPDGLVTTLSVDGDLVAAGVTPLADGGHALTATARDAAGDETRVDRVFFIGNAATVSGCGLGQFDPADGAAVFSEHVHISGRSGGAAGVLIDGLAAAVAAGSFCGDATLAPGRNEVTIRCADASGNPTTDAPVTLVLYRYDDPVVTIASPAANSSVTTSSVTVSGTVGAGVVSGDVNGIAFTVADDGADSHSFSVPNVPVAPGLSVLTVRAKTRSARVGIATTRVRALTAAPQLSITAPLTGSDSGASSIDVTGTYANVEPATITVSAGGTSRAATATPQSDTTGTFTASVPVASAAVTVIEATARNAAGTQTTARVNVTQLAGGPSIAIDTPRDNTYLPSTQSGAVRVAGTFTGDAGSAVQVNGVNATLTANAFAADVTLSASSSGITPLIARVTAPDARDATDAVRVIRFAEPLAVRESFPANDAADVERGVALVVLFNHALDGATAANAFQLTSTDGSVDGPVDGDVFVDRDAITFAPHQPLRAGVRYTATIASSLHDVAGGALASPYTFAFTAGGSAPSNAPILDEATTTGCFSGTTITGRVSPNAQARVEVDGVVLTAQASDTGAFKAALTFSGQTGYHLVRVRELGADGSLSAERALCYRLSCATLQVVGATLDRNAKTLAIQFSKPMDLASLIASPSGTLLVTPEGESALTGTVALDTGGQTATITFASLPAKNITLTVKKSVKDAGGASLTADYTQTFTYSTDTTAGRGNGYVSGAVYDATNGRPLAGAQLEIAAVNTLTTSDRGRYSYALPEGAYTVRAGAPGYTTVWRQVVVPAGAGVVPIDIRLTKGGDEKQANNAALTLQHGADTAVTKRVELALAVTSLAGTHRVRLTSVGGQSLAGLLPLGWAPLASAEIAIDDASSPIALPGARLTFVVDANAITAAAQSLALVHYDSGADEWRVVVPAANVGSDGRASFDIDAAGNYALVYADKNSSLVARAGAALTGVANPCLTTPDTCRLTGRSFTLNPNAVLPSGRTVATLTTDGAKPYPSGTAVQAFIDEQLNLADGRTLVDPPFATDLLIYRNLAGTDGVADFHLAPTAQAQAVILRDGVDHIRIVDYPGRIDRGTLLGADGGRVPGDGNVLLDVPAAATPEPLHASVTSLSDNELASLGAVPGFRVAAGFTFSLTRANEPPPTDGVAIHAPALLTPARVTIAVPSASANAQVIVAEVLPSTPFGVLFRVVALMSASSSSTSNVFVSRPIVSTQLPLDGVVRDGRYVVLVADAPIAYAFGTVRSAGGAAVANARVTSGIGAPMSSVLGVRDLTRIDGVFVIPVAAKPAAPFSLVARTAALGDGAASAFTGSPDPDTFVDFGALTLSAQPPHLTAIAPADGAELDVTAPLVVQATFDTSIDAASVANGIRVTNLTTNAPLAGTVSLGGANSVRFNATDPLRAASTYAIAVLPTIRSTTGTPFGQTSTSTFSTRATPSNATIHADRIHITIPDANGKSRISGTAGALPGGAQAVAVRRNHFFVVTYDATVAADGSFAFDAGHLDARDRISVDDIIDLQVLDPVSHAIIAILRLTPFITDDGRGFLAPADLDTKYTTPDGLTVSVPAGAFDKATMVTLTPSQQTAFAAVPHFDDELRYANSLELKFDGVANKRLDVELPVPAGTDTANRNFLLGYLGLSVRGPRVMIVDSVRVDNGRFVTADATSGTQQTTQKRAVTSNAVLTGSALRNYLLGVNRSGVYSVLDIRVPDGSSVAWGAMTGLQAGYDLFWDTLQSLYAAHFYLAERRGTIAIPVLTNKPFQVVGVDAATGLQGFAKVYDPIPNGDPGAAAILPNPNPDREGPYPVYGTPFRVETLDLIASDTPVSIRNFVVKLEGDSITAVDSSTPLPADLQVTLFNVTNGAIDRKRSDGLKVAGALGDRVLLLVEEKEVDPYTSLSVVFSEPIAVGSDASDDAIDAYLRTRFSVEIAKEPAAAAPVYTAVTEQAHFRVDSGGRRVLVDLPASLQRGMRYRLGIASTVEDQSGLRIGQILGESGPTAPLAEPVYLYFRVREPGGLVSSFDLTKGAIRDQALNGNVLLMTALDGGVVAYDVADPASLGASTQPIGVAAGGGDEYWALASDRHGRVYATALSGLFGIVRSFRLEDFLPNGTPGPRAVTGKAGAIVSWRVGSTVGLDLASATILSDRAEALPRKMQILLQDDTEDLTLAFDPTADADDLSVFNVQQAMSEGYPYRLQRITVENETLDMRWSADAHPGVPAAINGIVARKNDRIHVIRNQRTYGVISLFGYGVAVFDLNAVESNDDPTRPANYKPLREQIRATNAALRSECGDPIDTYAIPDLTLSPDATIITRDGSPDLDIFAVDQRRGILDLKIAPPANDAEAAAPSDADTCGERAQFGLVLRNTYFTPGDPPATNVHDHPRLVPFRAKFAEAAGRQPTPRFTGAAYYHWTLEAQDNKALSGTSVTGAPPRGQRGSTAGTRVVRDYMLVPGYEYGLLVVEIGGTPPTMVPSYDPLANAHLVDIIWIPGGAAAVRAIPRTNLATVVDGEGRVLLVDLSRIDERFDSTGNLLPANALFKTVAASLASTATYGSGTYGVGADDPRIVWKSAPGVTSGTLAPVVDADTGYVYVGKVLEKTTSVIAAIDPRVQLKADVGDGNGLAEVGGLVPLGVDPPAGVIKGPEGSLAAFRVEVSLPGAMTQSLSGGANKLVAAIESERVFGATTEQMPEGFPRAHLRLKDRSGAPDPRADANFYLERVVPDSMAAQLRHQKGFNKFVSPWIVAIADPRASINYQWPTPPAGTTLAALQTASGCSSCARPPHLAGKTEADRVWELYTNGRLISIRPDLCIAGTDCAQNVFTGTSYAYLGRENRFTARFATIMADTVRPPSVLVAAQAPPVAGGALQETTYLHSGEVETSALDMDAGGRNGWNALFDRTYRSRTIGGTVGMGWESSIFRRLRALPNGDVEYRDGAGEIWRFTLDNATGFYQRPKGLFLKLSRTDRGWVLVDQKARISAFDSMGRLVHETDEFAPNAYALDAGNVVRYLYDLSGRLAQVIDPVGRVSRLMYFPDGTGLKAGRLQSIESWLGRVDYDYDDAGRLITATLPETGTGRPTTQYGYGTPASTYNDKLELAPNLTSITDPMGEGPRVAFAYSTSDRDKVKTQTWKTGESATFTYTDATHTTTKDVLGQERVYELTPQPGNYTTDRAHVRQLDETNVAAVTTPFGTLPAAVTPSGAPTESLTRRMLFTYVPDGMLETATLSGIGATSATIRTTTNTYKSIEPGAPGFVLFTSETSGSGATPIKRTFGYDDASSNPRPAYLESVSIGSDTIHTSEPSAMKKSVAATNDAITTTVEVDAYGQPKTVTSTGGTDAGGNASVSYKFRDATAPEYARAMPELVDASGLQTKFAYPGPDQIKVDEERGVSTLTNLDGWRRPVSSVTTGPSLSLEESSKYDLNGRLTETTHKQDAHTVTTSLAYDPLGRVKQSTTNNVAVGESLTSVTTTTDYDLTNRKIVRMLPGGAVVTEELDGLGRVAKRTTTTGGTPIVEQYAYDLAGNLVYSADNHSASAVAYDVHGRATASLAPNGVKTVTDYDDWGNPKSIKTYDAVGTLIGESQASYTPNGRMTSAQTRVDATQTRESEMKWDGAGRITSTAVSGRAAKQAFDDAGRLKSSIAGAGTTSTITTEFSKYLASDYTGGMVKNGTLTERGATSPIDMQYDYDTLGNPTRNQAGALEWKRSYDEDGNVTADAPPARESTRQHFDARGNLLSKREPGAPEVKYGYHAAGTDTSYRDESDGGTGTGLTETTESDLLGRPSVRRYPDGTQETWTYDGSRLASMKDRQGRLFNYTYDDKNQLTEIRRNGGELIEKLDYDAAGRITTWRTRDAALVFEDYDFEDRPRRTKQTRFKDHSGFGSATVLDSYEQDHTWNVHGERESWTMPSYSGFPTSATQWTQKVGESHDAAGNVSAMTRTLIGAPSPMPLLTADYRNAGRPNVRTLTTSASAVIERQYTYDTANAGQLSELRIVAGGNVVGGSAITYDGVQIKREQLLGISADTRFNEYSYDARSRLLTTVTAHDDSSNPSIEHVTDAGFRTQLERPSPSVEPAAPPTLNFDELSGHRIGTVAANGESHTFTYIGAERTGDGRYQYEFDDRGRIITATEIPTPSLTIRRFRYDYAASNRIVGRRVEYAQLSSISMPPLDSDWKLENRDAVLFADGLPAETTFVWDPISDRLVSVYKAGASANPSVDANGGLLRQLIHGDAAYDDPLEVTVTDGVTPDVHHFYPVFDEAGNGNLQLILGDDGKVISRTVVDGAYGEEESSLAGAAIDRITLSKTKDASGNLTAVEVSIRSTEALDEATLATGTRLAAVTASGNVVRTATVTSTLSDPNTIHWTLTPTQWTALTSPTGDVQSLSIAVTNTLRAKAWSTATPILPPPTWATTAHPIHTSPTLPVEYRASLATLTSFLAAPDPTTTPYAAPSLAALGSPAEPAVGRSILMSSFQALPFEEVGTGLVFARERWFDAGRGAFLSPDPLGYVDASNLYTFAGGDPVNDRDPSGLQKPCKNTTLASLQAAGEGAWQWAKGAFVGFMNFGGDQTVKLIDTLTFGYGGWVHENAADARRQERRSLSLAIAAVERGEGTPVYVIGGAVDKRVKAIDAASSSGCKEDIARAAAPALLDGYTAVRGTVSAMNTPTTPAPALATSSGVVLPTAGVIARSARSGPMVSTIVLASSVHDSLGEGPESDAVTETGARGAGVVRNPRHHVFPQEFRAFFEVRGFTGGRDIDQFTLELDEAIHQAIHGGGNYRLGRKWEGEWNRQIMSRISQREKLLGRALTFAEVFDVGKQMMRDYGLSGSFVPFRQ